MKVKGTVVDIQEIRALLFPETVDEELFRNIIKAVFHRHNAAYAGKYVRDLLVECGLTSTEVDNMDDYLTEWIRQIQILVPKETTRMVSLEYSYLNTSSIIVWTSEKEMQIDDPISDTLRVLEGLVRKVVNDGGYVEERLKKFFNL